MAWFSKYPRIQAAISSFSGLYPKQRPTYGDGWEDNKSAKAENAAVAHHTGFKPMFNVSYDGETDQGAMGPIKRYWLDHIALRARSWQSYLDSDITQGIINKYTGWIIGGGLKLQSEPDEMVLSSEGISISKEDFSKKVEARFKVYTRSKMISHNKQKNLAQIAKTAHINAVIGGDVLVVLRLVSGNITIQLIDGSQVQQPLFLDLAHAKAKDRGNKIRHGVETNKRDEPVAFYIRKRFNESTRIRAKSAGRLTAFMVHGLEYRIDGVRGIPLISAVMQKIKMVDRYSEATVGSAEERQKVVFAIEHNVTSTGENPLLAQARAAFNADAETQTGDIDGEATAAKVAATTNKQAINMPIGATLKALESKNELYYKDFYQTNVNAIASALGIPPEVAYSKYDSNFSASRAALKDWEHTIMVQRGNFSTQFYQNVYNFWLEIEILKNKIQAPGYLVAQAGKNNMVIESFQSARFVGANVPHIDPVKEVLAERLKLGTGMAHASLTTAEAATEALNGGDYDTNIAQVRRELTEAEELRPPESEHLEPEDDKDDEE